MTIARGFLIVTLSSAVFTIAGGMAGAVFGMIGTSQDPGSRVGKEFAEFMGFCVGVGIGAGIVIGFMIGLVIVAAVVAWSESRRGEEGKESH